MIGQAGQSDALGEGLDQGNVLARRQITGDAGHALIVQGVGQGADRGGAQVQLDIDEQGLQPAMLITTPSR